MRKKSKNMGFFDFRKVYRPAEISGRKKISPKPAKMYIFKLIKYWRPMLKIWSKYEDSLGGGEGPLQV
jgi:hypothetical protein